MENTFAPFISPGADQASGWAHQVVSTALALDLIFRRSKAFFMVRLVDNQHYTQYDEWSMEKRDVRDTGASPRNQGSQQVSLAIVPGLQKLGNSEGRNYTSSLMLEKMEVVCGVSVTGPVTGPVASDEPGRN